MIFLKNGEIFNAYVISLQIKQNAIYFNQINEKGSLKF